jgi:hypothetical protein
LEKISYKDTKEQRNRVVAYLVKENEKSKNTNQKSKITADFLGIKCTKDYKK